MTKIASKMKGVTITLLFILLISCSNGGGDLFEGSGDIGNCKLQGSMSYDKQSDTYTLTGAGTNMWAGNDEFFMVWRKESGDFSLSASGFLIEDGRFTLPVEQIVVSGNFFELLHNITSVGNDLRFSMPESIGCVGMPSILVKNMNVSGE